MNRRGRWLNWQIVPRPEDSVSGPELFSEVSRIGEPDYRGKLLRRPADAMIRATLGLSSEEDWPGLQVQILPGGHKDNAVVYPGVQDVQASLHPEFRVATLPAEMSE